MSDEYQRRYAEIAALHHQAVIAEDSTEPLFQRATAAAERLATDFPLAADAQHLAGLCWYDSLGSAPDRLRRAEGFFRRAMALDPSHPFAFVYLAYLLFDQGRMAEALPLFQMTDRSFFEKQGQQWRNLKTDELILVCRLRLGADWVAAGEVGQLVERFLAMGSPEAPVPRELAECAADLARQGALEPEIGRHVERLVESLGYERPLRAALDTIRAQEDFTDK
jgi:hypothetical protein